MTTVVNFVELPNDVRLPYVEQGDPSNPPVLFLHGFADSWRSFEPVLAHLPKSVHAIALTQRGHGEASHPQAGYRLQDFAEDLALFMDAKAIPAAVIVGHSMGSAVAQRFAICYPGRTLGLVLVGAHFLEPGDQAVREFLNSTVSRLMDPVDPAFVRQFAASMLVQPIPEEFFEAMLQDALKVPSRVWKQVFEGRLLEDLAAELGGLRCPTLLIWGEQDGRSLRSDQNALLAAMPGSRLEVYSGAGHLLHWEEPRRFASDVASFVEEVVSGAPVGDSKRSSVCRSR